MAFAGSTVTVLLIVPVVGGAISTMRTLLIDAAVIEPPVHCSTLLASGGPQVKPAPSRSSNRWKTVPGGSGSRRTTPLATSRPLLPTTKSYVKPPRHTAGPSSGGLGGTATGPAGGG